MLDGSFDDSFEVDCMDLGVLGIDDMNKGKKGNDVVEEDESDGEGGRGVQLFQTTGDEDSDDSVHEEGAACGDAIDISVDESEECDANIANKEQSDSGAFSELSEATLDHGDEGEVWSSSEGKQQQQNQHLQRTTIGEYQTILDTSLEDSIECSVVEDEVDFQSLNEQVSLATTFVSASQGGTPMANFFSPNAEEEGTPYFLTPDSRFRTSDSRRRGGNRRISGQLSLPTHEEQFDDCEDGCEVFACTSCGDNDTVDGSFKAEQNTNGVDTSSNEHLGNRDEVNLFPADTSTGSSIVASSTCSPVEFPTNRVLWCEEAPSTDAQYEKDPNDEDCAVASVEIRICSASKLFSRSISLDRQRIPSDDAASNAPRTYPPKRKPQPLFTCQTSLPNRESSPIAPKKLYETVDAAEYDTKEMSLAHDEQQKSREQELLDMIAELRRQVIEVTNDRDKSVATIRSLESDIEDIAASNEDEVNRLQTLLKKSEVVLDEMNSMLTSKESTINALTTKNNELVQAVSQIAAEVASQLRSGDDLQEEGAKLTSEQASLASILNTMSPCTPVEVDDDCGSDRNSSVVHVVDESFQHEYELEAAIELVVASKQSQLTPDQRSHPASEMNADSFEELQSNLKRLYNKANQQEEHLSLLRTEKNLMNLQLDTVLRSNEDLLSENKALQNNLSTKNSVHSAEVKRLGADLLETTRQKSEAESSLSATAFDLAEIKEDVASGNESINQLQSDNFRLFGEVSASALQLADLKHLLNETVSAKKIAEERCLTLEEQHEKTECNLNAVTHEKNELLLKMDATSLLLISLEAEKQSLLSIVEDTQEENTNVVAQRDDLLQEIGSLQQLLSETTAKIESSDSLLDSAQLEIKTLNGRVSSLESDKEAYLQLIKDVRHQLACKEKAFDDLELLRSDQSNEMESLLSDMSAANIRNSELNEELSCVSAKLEDCLRVESDLRQQLLLEKNEISSRDGAVVSLRDEVASLTSRLVYSHSLLMDEIAMREQLEDTCRGLTSEQDEISGRLSHAISEKERLSSDVQAKSLVVSTLEEEMKSLTLQLRDREVKNISNENKLASTEEERDEIALKLKESVSKNNQHQDAISRLTKEMKDTKALLHIAATERGILSQSNQTLETKVGALEEERVALVSRMKELESTICTLNESLSRVESDNEALKASVSQLTSEKQSFEESMQSYISTLNARGDELTLQLASKRHEWSKVLEQKAEHERQLESRIRTLNETVSSLQSEKEELSAAMDQTQAIEESLQASISKLNIKTDDLTMQLASKRQELSNLLEQKATIDQQLGETREERDYFRVKLDEVNAAKDVLEVSVDETKKQMQSMNHQIASLNDEKLLRLKRIKDLDVQLTTSEEQYAKDKLHLVASRDHFQDIASNFAASVIQLKLQSKMAMKRIRHLSARLAIENSSNVETLVLDDDACIETVGCNLQDTTQISVEVANLRVEKEALGAETEALVNSITSQEAMLRDLRLKVAALTEEKSAVEGSLLSLQSKRSSLDSRLDIDRNTVHRNVRSDSSVNSSGSIDSSESLPVSPASQVREILRSTHQFDDDTERVSRVQAIVSQIEGKRKSLKKEVKNLQVQLQSEAKSKDFDQLQALLKAKDALIDDLTQQIEATKAVAANAVLSKKKDAKMIAYLKSDVDSVQAQLLNEQQVTSNLNRQMMELRNTNLQLVHSREEMLQEMNQLIAESSNLHGDLSSLQVDNDSLKTTLTAYQEKALLLSRAVASLETQTSSQEDHTNALESQLAAKDNELNTLTKTVACQTDALEGLRSQLLTVGAEKASAEGALRSLRSEMTDVKRERDDLASQLEIAVKELGDTAMVEQELNQRYRSNSDALNYSIDSFESVGNLEISGDISQESPGTKQIRLLLNSCQISDEDIDHVRDKMSKVQTIVSHIEGERKTLKKKVIVLQGQMKCARKELAVVMHDCIEKNDQALALRDEVDQTRLLLKESELKSSQLASTLERVQNEIKTMQSKSSESYNALIIQSQHEISRLKMELHCRDVPKILPSSPTARNTSFETPIASNKSSNSSPSLAAKTNRNTRSPTSYKSPKKIIRSKDRFEVKKGQSLFGGLLKDTKKTGRKDRLKYRQGNSNELFDLPGSPISPGEKRKREQNVLMNARRRRCEC